MKLQLLAFLTLITASALAQKEGGIDNQTFEIEKKKKIDLPPANRLYNKLQPFVSTDDDRKIDYNFRSNKLAVGSPKMTPAILPVQKPKTAEEAEHLDNLIKIGAGNYGKIYGEAFAGGHSEDAAFDVSYKHLSNQTGPVDEKNSASSDNRARLNGEYGIGTFKLGASAYYDRNNYYFYSKRATDRETIRQTINNMGAQLLFENTDNTTAVDYALKTSINRLTDRYDAGETDWNTNFSGAMSLTSNIFALVGASASVSQRSNIDTYNRNMFRVEPAFKFVFSGVTIKAAFKAVNETDDRLKINRTVGFPSVEVDVVPFGGVHFFAGYDGDVQRNTLRSLLVENRWLANTAVVANTEKNRDIYGGLKGELGAGFQFEGKASYATYKNFYVFNNDWVDTTRFAVLYDADYINVLTISAQVGYTYENIVRSTLRADFSDYGIKRLEQPWGRPRFTATWNNSFIFAKKLFATLDAYYMSGMQFKNFRTNKITELKPIVDMNLKIDYLLTRHFSAFVSVNNFLGQTYQRYMGYPQQGLNFLGGISVQF